MAVGENDGGVRTPRPYGLVAYNTERRTSEIGIRMALGASRGRILTPILRKALLLAGCGLAAGLPLTLALGWLVRSQLFGIPPHDLPTLVGSAVIFLGGTLASAWIPAQRASGLSPTVALRAE